MLHRYCIWICILIFPCLAWSQHQETHHRARIYLEGRDIKSLGALGIETDHGEYAPYKHLTNDFSEEELRTVHQAGFSYEVLIPDVQAYYRDPTVRAAFDATPRSGGFPCEMNPTPVVADNYPVPAHFRLGSMAGFYTYQDMLAILDTMRMLYPHLISAKRIVSPSIVTHEGNPIYWLRISDNPDVDESAEPEVLYNALHHAREPNSLTQLIYYMWYLLENYETNPEVQFIVDNTALYFIPCVNPDGYIHNELIEPNGGGLWRKNRNVNSNGTFGVDLNRNYGYEWGHDDFGSSPNPGSQVYRGTGAFSEPETQAMRAFCNAHEFVVALNYHSYGNLLIYPWGYSDTPSDDAATFNNLAAVMTTTNNYLPGVGSETVGYVTNGVSDDWMYGETTTKPSILSMTPEVGSSNSGFWPPVSEIVPNCKATMWMNLAAAVTPHNAGLLQVDAGQSVLEAQYPYLRYKLRRFGLADGTLTAHLTALDEQWVEVLSEPAAFNLANNEMAADSFALRFAEELPHGTPLRLLLHLDNGAFTHTDTITLHYVNFETTLPYEADFTTLGAWGDSETWNVTAEDYVSAPSSLTDSPYDFYADNASTFITLDTPIDIGEAEDYRLRFWTKWNIEADYDYAQLQLSVNDGEWMPACGRYTVAGTNWQARDEPLWEGIRMDWVQEEIDLNGHVNAGDALRLRFLLRSDGAVRMDGFYVDDLMYEERNIDVVSAVQSIVPDDFTVRVFPNPTAHHASIQLKALPGDIQHGEWTLLHSSGHSVQQGRIRHHEDRFEIDTTPLPAGSYWLKIRVNDSTIRVQKLVVVK